MVPEVPVIVMQLVDYNVEMTLSPLETTISRELERRYVNSWSSDGKEHKQKKVQNWRTRLIRYRHVFDDDSLRQVEESNDPRSLG